MINRRNLQIALAAALIMASAACNSSGSSSDIKYTALGASDAVGIGADPLDRGYVFQIEEQLDQQCGDTELINLGIPGAEADEIEDIEVPGAIAADPELITVFAGGNDLVSGRGVDSFEGNLAEILQQLRNDTDAQIYVANLPDLSQLPRFQQEPDPDVTRARVDAFNQAIARQTAAVGAVPVDLFSAGVNQVQVSEDGFHPSTEGHQAIADLFLEQILASSLCRQ